MNTRVRTQKVWASVACAAALGVARVGAAQPLPPVPAIAPVPPVPSLPIPPVPSVAPMAIFSSGPFVNDFDREDDREDQLYERARDAIENGRYERAVTDLDRVIGMSGSRTDAALYWKAYSLAKIGQRADALSTLADMERRFKDSRWSKDAKALEVEVRQASGQAVPPDAQADEELKMYALNALMQSDPERALPAIEKIMSGTASIKLKERALFVLSQSRSARAHDILSNLAKGGANPDLQLKAIRYIGIMGGGDSRQILDDAYRASADAAVKRAILRSFMTAGDRTRLLSLAKTEKDPALRGEAVQQLGVMRADAELAELYQTETSVEVKKRILQAMFVGGSDKLTDLARNEREPELRRAAIHNLGLMRRPGAAEALTSIYASDQNVEIRKAVVNALFLQQNATALIALARSEKSPEMKVEIVKKLGIMPKSKEVQDYLAELLK